MIVPEYLRMRASVIQTACCLHSGDVTLRPTPKVWGPLQRGELVSPHNMVVTLEENSGQTGGLTEAGTKDTGRRRTPTLPGYQFLPTSPTPGPSGYVCCSMRCKGFQDLLSHRP